MYLCLFWKICEEFFDQMCSPDPAVYKENRDKQPLDEEIGLDYDIYYDQILMSFINPLKDKKN